MAPVGLLGRGFPGHRFDLACEIAALTNGHSTGYVAAGALASCWPRSSTMPRRSTRHSITWSCGSQTGRATRETLDALRAARACSEPGTNVASLQDRYPGW